MDVARDFHGSFDENMYFVEGHFGPRRHIYVLLFVVMVICSSAIWYVLRTSRIVFAQESSSQNTVTSSTDFAGRQETGIRVKPLVGVKEPSGASGKDASGALSAVFTSEVRHWEAQILKWSEQFDVDPNIVATIMQIESCGNPVAVSYAGASGLFQVMPFHFRLGEDMFDPNTNAMRGLAFFKEQLRFTGGDIDTSFAGYNGGYAASGGAYATWPAETKRYFYWAKGIYTDAKAGVEHSETLAEWLSAGGSSLCRIAASEMGIEH